MFLDLVLSVVQMSLFSYIFSCQKHLHAPTIVKRHYSVWNLCYAPYINFIHSFHLSRASVILSSNQSSGSCVKVEVAVLGSPSLMVFVDAKQHVSRFGLAVRR